MSWVNLYKPPAPNPPADPYGPDPYDINWPLPVHLQTLENDVIQLLPYIPRLYAKTFWSRAEPGIDSIARFIPRDMATLGDYLESLEDSRRDPGWLMFVVIDKTRPAKAQVEDDLKLKGQIAGQLALMRTIPSNLTAEVGFIVTLPEYQRTHVTSNAIGLLLKYALNLPTDPAAPGLGFRRVDWRTHSWNTPSVTTARRLGFVDEGILRWFVTLPPGREGNEPREGQDNQRKGRHTAFLAMCWDVWEARGRATVEKQMCRRE